MNLISELCITHHRITVGRLFNLFQNTQTRGNEIPYSDFLNAVESRTVSEVLIQGNRISGKFSDTGLSFSTYAPEDPGLVERLRQQNIKIAARPSDEDVPSFLSVLVSWFPMLLLIAVWVFFMRQMQSGSGRAMGFGKSKAKLLTERHGRVTFDESPASTGQGRPPEIVPARPQSSNALAAVFRVARCGWPRDRQDASGPRRRGRGRCSVLHYFRLGFRRDVRRRRRQPGARHVRAGEEERALHHLHRRD